MNRIVTDSNSLAGEGHGPVVDLTERDFDKALSENTVVFVDFWAPWCAPCRAFAPIYEGVAHKYPQVLFAKVNVDVELKLAERYPIRSIPSLYIFVNRALIHTRAGALSGSALEAVVGEVVSHRPSLNA